MEMTRMSNGVGQRHKRRRHGRRFLVTTVVVPALVVLGGGSFVALHLLVKKAAVGSSTTTTSSSSSWPAEDQHHRYAPETRWVVTKNSREFPQHFPPPPPEQHSDTSSWLWNHDDETNQHTMLPTWYQDYARWHRDTLAQLQQQRRRQSDGDDHHDWKDFRYLLVRCVQRDLVCGGAADRLSNLPAIIYLAHRARRLLFIYWTKPAALTEFLRPHMIDWQLPVWLIPLLAADTPRLPWSFVRAQLDDGHWDQRPERVITIKRLHHGVIEYYDAVHDDVPLQDSYHAIWAATFQPSPPVRQRIAAVMSSLHLVTNQYIGLHIRSLYQVNATLQRDEMENAIHCTMATMRKMKMKMLVNHHNNNDTTTTSTTTTTTINTTIFVAADAPSSARYAVQYGAKLGLRMVQRSTTGSSQQLGPPLHLDRGRDYLDAASMDWQRHNVTDYYDIFVDLYLLAASRCVQTGLGGYGIWASRIGQSPHADDECVVQRNVTTVCPKSDPLKTAESSATSIAAAVAGVK
jgi:hypothetical protein